MTFAIELPFFLSFFRCVLYICPPRTQNHWWDYYFYSAMPLINIYWTKTIHSLSLFLEKWTSITEEVKPRTSFFSAQTYFHMPVCQKAGAASIIIFLYFISTDPNCRAVLELVERLICRNPTIFNMIRWEDGTTIW